MAGNPNGFCSEQAVHFQDSFTYTKSKYDYTVAGAMKLPANNRHWDTANDGLLSGPDGWQDYGCIIKLETTEGTRCVKLRITNAEGSQYIEKNLNTRGRKFNMQYNGGDDGMVSVGSYAAGSYSFVFTFTFEDTGLPADLPYLPLTFYDLDGKKLRGGGSYETARTCDAEGVATAKDTLLVDHKFDDVTGCAEVTGGQQEVPQPKDWEQLAGLQRRVAATFGFKGKHQFTMEYETKYIHRIFILRGTNSLACVK